MRSLPARLWVLAAFSGLLQVLAFPIEGPAPSWREAICWVALLPLFLCLTAEDGRKRSVSVLQAAFLGYLCGFIFYLGNCFWILQTMHLYGGLPLPVAGGVLVLFCLYLGLYPALFGALVASSRLRFGRGIALLLSPFLWVAVELARARITGFPWDLLGIAQIDNPLLTQLAPFAGAYGLSFVVAAFNALWLARLQVRDRRFLRPALALGAVAIAGLYLVAIFRLPLTKHFQATATATLVQENLEVGAANTAPYESEEAMLASFSNLSASPPYQSLNRAAHQQSQRLADLIVWPESPAGFRTNDPTFQAATTALAQTTHAPLVIGSLGLVPDSSANRSGFLYDSAALVARDGTQIGRYDKIHLVPFGEYVPFKDLFFFAKKLTAGVGDMDAGAARTVFRTSSAGGVHAFGIFICYESIFGDEVRQFVRTGAEVLVNISDDGWYGDSGAPWQHLNMARMRAIENRRWILRATNTGITCVIDPNGRVLAVLPRHLRSAIHLPFGFEQRTTFYTRHGDLFAYLCALVTMAALALSFRPRVD